MCAQAVLIFLTFHNCSQFFKVVATSALALATNYGLL